MPAINLNLGQNHMKSAKTLAKISAWLAATGIIVGGFLWYWHHSEIYPSTDDAYIDANIVHIAPQVSGPVSKIYVQNYEVIKKNQELFDIDPRPFMIALKTAQANLALTKQKVASAQAAVLSAQAVVVQRQSELVLAQRNEKRIMQLVGHGQISKQEGDKVTSNEQVAQAALTASKNQLKQAQAELGKLGNQNAQIRAATEKIDQAKLNLSYTHISAPEAGILVNFKTRVGNMVQAGQPLFDTIENNVWWVNANFKETQLQRIRAGQTANVIVDIYPDHVYHGTVAYISPGSGASFSILPVENATGNWVKVTQRFPVKIMITNLSKNFPLRVGASASVTVDTAK